MKMKHFMFVLAAAFLITLAFIGCSQKSGASADGAVTEITLISNKIEIDEALKGFAAVYEKQTGIKVNIRSFGGETPYAPNIAAMFNSGTEPEIFVFEGRAGYEDARNSGRLTDLSGEPWVNDTDVAYIDPVDGKVIGFPVAIEGWGLGYNKELLAKAGVDPRTLVNIDGIRAAFEKIDSMKGTLGIDAVVSMVSGPGMTWVTGLHGVNSYLTLGLPYTNSTKYIDMLNNGQVDSERLTRFAEYMNLLFRYSNRNTLLTGGYDQQLGDYAIGKTVFIHQGNWTDPTFADLGITFEMGYVPHAFLPETTDGIFVGAPSYYIINAKSKGIEEARKFLIAMSSTPEGHDYMVNKAGMVPAFKSCRLQPAGQFSKAVQEWSAQGKIYSWQQNDMPDGFGMNILGPIFGQMAAGQIDVREFVNLFTRAVADIK
ncbi:MAG: ABC transporter substrate-binding protein [Treponema sp.]|nr:ABC transporter substrate-binding protein [Treponema sp.]